MRELKKKRTQLFNISNSGIQSWVAKKHWVGFVENAGGKWLFSARDAGGKLGAKKGEKTEKPLEKLGGKS